VLPAHAPVGASREPARPVRGDGVWARVEALFRGAGLAIDLLRFVVGHLRAGGAGPVLIGADPEDTVKHLYARFGSRPAAVARSRLRGR
jgi:hypothetical protein